MILMLDLFSALTQTFIMFCPTLYYPRQSKNMSTTCTMCLNATLICQSISVWLLRLLLAYDACGSANG